MNFLKRWLFLSYLSIKYFLLVISRAIFISPIPYHKITRMYLEEAGGAFIKIGQILALRYEILPPEYCLELSELFDNVPSMDWDTVKSIIATEYGNNQNDIFTLIEESPIASASFAQVHKAILASGKEVAVKIQRPGLMAKIKEDFRFLRFLSFFVSPILHLQAFKLREILDEMEKTTVKELNFRLEKDNAEIIRKSIDRPERFLVPETYSDITTEKVLVQDFVNGLKLTDVIRSRNTMVSSERFAAIDFDLDKIASDITAELARQYFQVGTYHSDPHPGNILITKDNKIAFVDFGIVGTVSKYSRALFWNFVKHIAIELDPEKAAVTFLRLGLRSIEDRIRFLSQENNRAIETYLEILKKMAEVYEKPLGQIVGTWSNSIGHQSESLYNRSTAVSFIKAMRIAESYNVHFHTDLIHFIRTLVIDDMMAMQISPTFRMDLALQGFAKEHSEMITDLEKYLLESPQIENQKLADPYDEFEREKAKEFLTEWFQDLVEDRGTLYNKIKQPAEKLMQLI